MKSSFLLAKEDLLWAESGDFNISEGDIVDTRAVSGSGFMEEIMQRIKSSTEDWKLEPNYGATLQDFEGEENNEETWTRIQLRLTEVLSEDFLQPSQFSINIIPLGDDEIAVRIDFSSDLQVLMGKELPSIKMVYNMITNNSLITR